MSVSPIPAATYDAVFVQAGEPGMLDETHALQNASATLAVLHSQPTAQISWWVDGYDDDKRSLWDIPEVAEQIRRCAKATGFVDGYNLPPHRLSAQLITLLVKCDCFPQGHPFTVKIIDDA